MPGKLAADIFASQYVTQDAVSVINRILLAQDGRIFQIALMLSSRQSSHKAIESTLVGGIASKTLAKSRQEV